MEQVLIKNKKALYIRFSVLLILLTVLFGWLYLSKVMNSDKSIDIMQSVYAGATFACLISLIRCLIKVFSTKPLLILNQNGIQQIADLGGSSIKWSEITGSTVLAERKTNTLLVIHLKNTGTLINQVRGYKRKALEVNVKKFGSPLVLNSLLLDFDVKTVQDFIDQYKNGSNEE